MALEFYNAYLNISKTPKETYKDGLQAMIDAQFDNSSTVNTIKEESGIGTEVYADIEVRLNKVKSPSNYKSLGYDYRKVIYSSPQANKIGIRYQFNSNYWIAINNNIFNMPTSSMVAIRCNNNLKWVDSDDVAHDEPCHIDFSPSSDNFIINSKVPTIEDEILVICQDNDETDGLFVNQRLIFGKRNVYKITKINDCIDNNVLYITLRIDQQVDGSDDFTNEVADNDKPTFVV